MVSMGFHDTITWYDKNAKQYAKAGELFVDLHQIQAFVSKLPKDAHVLDAGCGSGRDTALLERKGDCTVTGLDLSKGLLEVARQNHPEINFIEGNLLDLPFRDAWFDGVWSNASLLHLETVGEVEQALSEMYRVSKPGGHLHVLVKAQTTEHKMAVVADTLSGDDRFFQFFTAEELNQLLNRAGFDEINISEYSETDTISTGRPEVRLLWAQARKPH